MPTLVVHGASLACDKGLAPASLIVPPHAGEVRGTPLATVTHHQPIANISPFGMCTSMANPSVQAATAAALGVLTPAPCVPNTPSPWQPGSARGDIAGDALLTSNSTCSCMWAGTISITDSGTTTAETKQ